MLTNLMTFRNACRRFYLKYQFLIELVIKFILSFEAYDRIVTALNYSPLLERGVIKLGFGVAGAILPPIITVILCICIAVYEVFAGSPIMALLALMVFVVLYCFAARFSGKYAYAIVAIPLLVHFNLHYLVALLLGLTATPVAIFPAIVGVVTYYIFGAIKNSITGEKISSLDAVLDLYQRFMTDIFVNKEMIVVAALFAAVIIVMWAVKKLRFDYSFEVTIVLGGVLMVVGHIVGGRFADITVTTSRVIIGTVFSVLMAYVIQFFMMILNYSGTESVQFEDDDYYYYVKAVPKLDKVVIGEVVVSEEAKEAAKNRSLKAFLEKMKEQLSRKDTFEDEDEAEEAEEAAESEEDEEGFGVDENPENGEAAEEEKED